MPWSRARASPDLARSRIIARFKLGKDAYRLERGPAARCRPVEPLLMQDQVHTLGVKLAQQKEWVSEWAVRRRETITVALRHGWRSASRLRQ